MNSGFFAKCADILNAADTYEYMYLLESHNVPSIEEKSS